MAKEGFPMRRAAVYLLLLFALLLAALWFFDSLERMFPGTIKLVKASANMVGGR